MKTNKSHTIQLSMKLHSSNSSRGSGSGKPLYSICTLFVQKSQSFQVWLMLFECAHGVRIVSCLRPYFYLCHALPLRNGSVGCTINQIHTAEISFKVEIRWRKRKVEWEWTLDTNNQQPANQKKKQKQKRNEKSQTERDRMKMCRPVMVDPSTVQFNSLKTHAGWHSANWDY